MQKNKGCIECKSLSGLSIDGYRYCGAVGIKITEVRRKPLWCPKINEESICLKCAQEKESNSHYIFCPNCGRKL